MSTRFYPFVSSWAVTATAAKVPTTTASDALGTRTDVIGYYTATAVSTSSKTSIGSESMEVGIGSLILTLMVVLRCVR